MPHSMTSRKKRTRSPRPSSREPSDQPELAALLHTAEPGSETPGAATPPPVASAESAIEEALATFSIEKISTAVRYWGDDVQDRGAAKVSGGFGPNACLVIEVLTLMSLNRERTVACRQGSRLALVVNEALKANPPLQPSEPVFDAVA